MDYPNLNDREKGANNRVSRIFIPPPPLRPIILHTFSVGFLIYGETLLRSSLPKHRDKECFKSRVIAQIVDSPVDPRRTAYAISMTTQNPTLRMLSKPALALFIYATYPYTLRRYFIAQEQSALEAPALVPSLWLISRVDSFTNAAEVEKMMIPRWEALGIPCRRMCWEDTEHVMHFKDRKEEYVTCLEDFLETALNRPDS